MRELQERRWDVRRWGLPALAALVGAAIAVALGQGVTALGGSCALLCNPLIAVPYGAVLGASWVVLRRKERG